MAARRLEYLGELFCVAVSLGRLAARRLKLQYLSDLLDHFVSSTVGYSVEGTFVDGAYVASSVGKGFPGGELVGEADVGIVIIIAIVTVSWA